MCRRFGESTLILSLSLSLHQDLLIAVDGHDLFSLESWYIDFIQHIYSEVQVGYLGQGGEIKPSSTAFKEILSNYFFFFFATCNRK